MRWRVDAGSERGVARFTLAAGAASGVGLAACALLFFLGQVAPALVVLGVTLPIEAARAVAAHRLSYWPTMPDLLASRVSWAQTRRLRSQTLIAAELRPLRVWRLGCLAADAAGVIVFITCLAVFLTRLPTV